MTQSIFSEGHALIMGVGADLPNTVDDARGLADILKDPDRCAYPNEQIDLLTGDAARRSGILAGLERMAKKTDDKSTVMIYFSGHGYHVKSSIGDAYYLMPFGYNVEQLKDTAISGVEFADKLKAIRAQKLLLLLDCCHAGGLADLKVPGLQFAKAPLPPEAQSFFAQGQGRVVIASSREDEYSLAGKPYSAFTLALIEALCGAGASRKDGYVRVVDLALHTREMVPKRTKDRQHPIMDYKQADNFVLAYYAGGEAEPKGLPFTEEPEIEPEPGAWSKAFDQRGQTVHGSQTNIAGNVHGPVFSGQFSGPVAAGGVAVDMRKVTINAPAQRTFLHQIGSPPRDFTGREDEIRKILAEFEKGAAVVGLFGMGGVGKTDLALVLASNLKNIFSDAQFFIDMRGTRGPPLTSEEAMAQVIHSFDATFRLPESQSELQGQYISVLEGKRALILLDNAAGREQVEPLLPPCSCCMLITSRHRFALKGMKAIDLDVLSLEDARQLLLANAERIGDKADELAELCGCLPLALRNAAYLLAERVDLDVTEYIDRLQNARKRLDLVEASFDLSYNLLASDLREKWSMLSIFPADFDRAGGATVWNVDIELAADLLGELVRWSLVNFYPAAKPAHGRYRLHDLARMYADSRLASQARIDGQLRHAAYYKELLSAADDLYLEGGPGIQAGLALFDREWANIRAGQSWAKDQMAKGISQELEQIFWLCDDFSNAGAYLLDLRLHPREKLPWLRASLEASRALKDWRGEGMHLGVLGLACVALGEFREAIKYHEQHLAIALEKGDRYSEGFALGNLGLAYYGMGELVKAIDFHDQALTISREGRDRRGEAADLGNLGLAYAALGESSRAIECYEQTLAIYREIGDRRGEGAVLGSMGIVERNLGKASKAIKHYEQALTIAQEIQDRLNEGAWLSDLGDVYEDMGKAETGKEYHDQALKIHGKSGKRPNITGFRCKLKFKR